MPAPKLDRLEQAGREFGELTLLRSFYFGKWRAHFRQKEHERFKLKFAISKVVDRARAEWLSVTHTFFKLWKANAGYERTILLRFRKHMLRAIEKKNFNILKQWNSAI